MKTFDELIAAVESADLRTARLYTLLAILLVGRNVMVRHEHGAHGGRVVRVLPCGRLEVELFADWGAGRIVTVEPEVVTLQPTKGRW